MDAFYRMRRALLLAASLLSCTPVLFAADQPIALFVDAIEAPRKIFHARLNFPVSPGPATFVYPKWIPGEHGPTGPITDVAGVRFTVGGKPVSWRRDPVDMYAFHVDVPQGASVVEAAFDYLSPA